MLMLCRKLLSGVLYIKDRVPKCDEAGNPVFDDEGKEIFEMKRRVIKAGTPDLYAPHEYSDEDFVLQHHGAIMKRPEDVPEQWWEEMGSNFEKYRPKN